MKTFGILAVIALLIALGAYMTFRRQPTVPINDAALPQAMPQSGICMDTVFEGDTFIVCAMPSQKYRIELALKGGDGKAYGKIDKAPDKATILFAMNGGMYHEDMSPVGLYVENGEQMTPLNEANATGNFFMKPNGVFYVDKAGKVGVLETSAYKAAQPDAAFATQSGPMLVVDGQLHPRFEPDGASRNVRNGVGVDDGGRAFLVISRKPVSFGKFARVFRDLLGCRNALFLDGTISTLYDSGAYIVGGKYPVGPMIMVRAHNAQ